MRESSWKIAAVATFLILWETTARLEVFSPFIFPSISGSILWGSQNWQRLLLAVTDTGKLLLIGLTLGTVIGLIIGGLSVFSRKVEYIVEAFVSVFQPLPSICLLPFAILWFGLGDKPIIFIVTFSTMWPMILNSMTGFSTITSIYKDVGAMYGLKGASLARYIMIPAALPYIITGFRISWAHSWRTIISAELLFGAVGSAGGLGWVIYVNRYMLNPEGMIAAIGVISLIGIFMENVLLEKIENETIKKWGMKG